MEEAKIENKYLDFIESLVNQIGELLPEDVNKLQHGYLINNIRHSAILLASSIQTEPVFRNLDFEQQKMLIQLMAEWSFHKEIDLFRSGISPKYWKIVMQKIWYTMWEVMYACMQNEAPESVVLNLVERYVNRTYTDAIEELKDTNVIDEETEEKAKEQSNIDIMAKEYRKKCKRKKYLRIFKNILIFLFISLVITYVVLKYNTYGMIAIMIFLVIYNVAQFPSKRE